MNLAPAPVATVPGSLRHRALLAAGSGRPVLLAPGELATGDRYCPDGTGAGFEVMSVWEDGDQVEIEFDDPANQDELTAWRGPASESLAVRILGNSARCPACGAQHEGDCSV